MFPLPYAPPFGAILYTLLGLDLALLGWGLAFGPGDGTGSGRLPLSVRMALSAILVVAAGLQVWLGGAAVAYARWIGLGMSLGFLGDLIMARLIRVPDRLIFGMLAFGLGHMAYIAGLATFGLGIAPLNLALWALACLVGAGLWCALVQKPGGARGLNAAALVYSLLVATLNAFALSLAVRNAHFVSLALGALLFLASDTILGRWVIRGHACKRVNDLVWLTYNLGQLLIVYSTAAALNVLVGR